MPDGELRADYDRDSRLTLSAREYGARHTGPGAIAVANADADRRRWPASVSPGPRIMLDHERQTKSGADDELLPLKVLINSAAAVAGKTLLLRVSADHAVRTRIYDDRGIILPTPNAARPGEHPLPSPGDYRLEARSFPGSPFGQAMTFQTRFVDDDVEEIQFRLELVARDSSGADTILDSGRFSLAPILFPSHDGRASRLYICANPGTLAAVTDVREALRRIGGVTLVEVPLDVSNGDNWLQDQFQPGLAQAADGWRHVIVHLPRTRSDFVGQGSPRNLADFVRSHFPARNVALIDDFWERTLTFSDAGGARHSLTYRETTRLANAMNAAVTILRDLNGIGLRLDPPSSPVRAERWSEARRAVGPHAFQLRDRIRMAMTSAPAPERSNLQARDADISSRVALLNRLLPVRTAPERFVLPVRGRAVEVAGETADRLFARVVQAESGANFGGNIESTPPTPDAPLGKLAIGNATFSTGDFMDPQLRRLLHKQKQPVVEFDTSWLDVGHLDEVLAFVPDQRSDRGFAALRASSALALDILHAAAAQYQFGLPTIHPDRGRYHPSSVSRRIMNVGTSPVTRLARGKHWRQSIPPPTAADPFPDRADAPRLYQELSRAFEGTGRGPNVPVRRYWAGPGEPRSYAADMTAFEILYLERDNAGNSTNAFVEDQYLQPVEDILQREFRGCRIFPMPVIFDLVRDVSLWERSAGEFTTSAFTPNVVNLQAVNGHLLVPRPYGPRMRPDDAIAVLTSVLGDWRPLAPLARRLTRRFLRNAGLETTIVWIDRQALVRAPENGPVLYAGLENLAELAVAFQDGFPGLPLDQIRHRIRQGNARHFTANDELREGWRRFTFNEGMVDLFEAYIALVADALGTPLHFVDSWFYHVRFGGIHCGTNVIREPPRRGWPRWWTV